jgi:hypothetical protein
MWKGEKTTVCTPDCPTKILKRFYFGCSEEEVLDILTTNRSLPLKTHWPEEIHFSPYNTLAYRAQRELQAEQDARQDERDRLFRIRNL